MNIEDMHQQDGGAGPSKPDLMTSEEYKVVEGDTDQVHHHDSHEEASSACVPFAGA